MTTETPLPYMLSHSFTQGCDFEITANLEVGGVPADLTGATFTCQLVDSSGALQAEIGDGITSAVNGGTVVFWLSAAATTALVGDEFKLNATGLIGGKLYPLFSISLAMLPPLTV